jgi:hypothetical protein
MIDRPVEADCEFSRHRTMPDHDFGLGLMGKDDRHLITPAHGRQPSLDQLRHTDRPAMPRADQSGPARLDLREVQRAAAMRTRCGQDERSAPSVGIDVWHLGHLCTIAGTDRADLYDKHLR